MSTIRRTLKRTTLPLLIVLCLAALTASYAYADGALRPLATQIIGDPDAAVTGKLAVGTATPGNKALTVVGVIDFLGAGTVHNYFTEGTGNNMQINTNVDEGNAVGDASRSQWKLVLGSNLDWFSIRRSPAGGTYNEDALFFIQGSTGRVGIATVDTTNGATIPFTPQARLHVQTASGDALWGETTDTNKTAVYGYASATTSANYGVVGRSASVNGTGVFGDAYAPTGSTYGVWGQSGSTSGYGVSGYASATTGANTGVYGQSDSAFGRGVAGWATATTGDNFGVYGRSDSTLGRGVYGDAAATTGANYGVIGVSNSTSGYGVFSIGDFAATGTKTAIVETDDYGWRHLYAMESPQNWFEDFGQATLVAGEVVVAIEPMFAETVNLTGDYHVFLTPLGGGCTLFVTDKTATGFTVRANEGAGCEIAFDYRIIAPRLEYEGLRLKEAQSPDAVAASLPAAPAAP
jgi:hypothetical protein